MFSSIEKTERGLIQQHLMRSSIRSESFKRSCQRDNGALFFTKIGDLEFFSKRIHDCRYKGIFFRDELLPRLSRNGIKYISRKRRARICPFSFSISRRNGQTDSREIPSTGSLQFVQWRNRQRCRGAVYSMSIKFQSKPRQDITATGKKNT